MFSDFKELLKLRPTVRLVMRWAYFDFTPNAFKKGSPTFTSGYLTLIYNPLTATNIRTFFEYPNILSKKIHFLFKSHIYLF